MPTDPVEIAGAAFAWLVASALVLEALRARAGAQHAERLARWSRAAVDAADGVHDVRVHVTGDAGGWTELGESEARREPYVEEPLTGVFIDGGGRPIQLDAPVRVLLGTPVRRRVGRGRRCDDFGGLELPYTIPTEMIDLPAGATLWIRATLREQDGCVRLAARGSLPLATGPSDTSPDEVIEPARPPLFAFAALSAVVQLPWAVLLLVGPAGTRPVALALLAAMPVVTLVIRNDLVDWLYPDGRPE